MVVLDVLGTVLVGLVGLVGGGGSTVELDSVLDVVGGDVEVELLLLDTTEEKLEGVDEVVNGYDEEWLLLETTFDVADENSHSGSYVLDDVLEGNDEDILLVEVVLLYTIEEESPPRHD